MYSGGAACPGSSFAQDRPAGGFPGGWQRGRVTPGAGTFMEPRECNVTDADERAIEQYLLDELPEREREAFEERLISDGELFEAVEACETELLRRLVCNETDEPRRSRLLTKYRSTPALKARLAFAETMRAAAAEPAPPSELARMPTQPPSAAPRPRWSLTTWLWRPRLVPALGVVALLVLTWLGGRYLPGAGLPRTSSTVVAVTL